MYIMYRIKRIMREGNVSNTAPLFPTKFWSVFERMELGIPKLKTHVEAWHRHLKLVGKLY